MPIIIGFTILDISKVIMYDFHYNVVKKKYGDKAQLLFTDTDSLTYHIETDNIDIDLHKMRNYFDFSNYNENHYLYYTNYNKELTKQNENMIGLFKDEAESKTITEFCGIRSKMYVMNILNDEKIKLNKKTDAGILLKNEEIYKNKNDKSYDKKAAKGVSNSIIKTLKMEDYKKCIFSNNKNDMLQKATYNTIRSINHNITSMSINKITLCTYDDKRFYIDNINSRSYGHYKNEIN